MSRQRVRVASSPETRPDKEAYIRALDLCGHMSRVGWEFIQDIPSITIEPVPDAANWVRLGLAVRVGEWLAITQEGLRHLGTRTTRSWLLALARMPPRQILVGLVQDSIVKNNNGFPILTPFGVLIQSLIEGSKSYVGAMQEGGVEFQDDSHACMD